MGTSGKDQQNVQGGPIKVYDDRMIVSSVNPSEIEINKKLFSVVVLVS